MTCCHAEKFSEQLDIKIKDCHSYECSLDIFQFILEHSFMFGIHEPQLSNHNKVKICECRDCKYNLNFVESFEALVRSFRRKRFINKRKIDKENSLIDKYIEKRPDLIYIYSYDIQHSFERLDLIEKFKIHSSRFAFSVGFKTLENMKKDCENNMEASKVYVKEFSEYMPDAINMLHRHYNARKIQRWFKKIRY